MVYNKRSMKQVERLTFSDILSLLSRQRGEEKLRISFHLSEFVRKLRKQGELYGERKSTLRSRTTA